jgi:predicted DNA-binding transcriptional regulator AlpA
MGSSPQNLERLLDTDQMAELIGITPTYARQLRLSGKGPAFVKIGGLVRYRPSSISAWLDERTLGSTSDETT